MPFRAREKGNLAAKRVCRSRKKGEIVPFRAHFVTIRREKRRRKSSGFRSSAGERFSVTLFASEGSPKLGKIDIGTRILERP